MKIGMKLMENTSFWSMLICTLGMYLSVYQKALGFGFVRYVGSHNVNVVSMTCNANRTKTYTLRL